MYFRWKSLGLIALNKTHNVNSSLKFLRRQSRFSTPSICRLLCNVLIQPPFDYGCTAWFSNLSKNLRVTLQAMQNKCIRLSLQLGNIWRVCAKEILELNWLNVHDRYIQVIVFDIFKLYNNQCPDYFNEVLCPFDDNEVFMCCCNKNVIL